MKVALLLTRTWCMSKEGWMQQFVILTVVENLPSQSPSKQLKVPALTGEDFTCLGGISSSRTSLTEWRLLRSRERP